MKEPSVTALMNAVVNNNTELVKQLIQDGANVDALDESLDSPLVIASYKGFTPIVQLLLNGGASVVAVDPDMKATALHAAAYAGNADVAILLIRHHIDINKQGPKNGYTALHDAIWQGHADVVKVLLEAGADLTLKTHRGETPFMFAQASHHADIAALIAQKMKLSGEKIGRAE
jgi:ankyrin repeat protein